MSLIATTAKAPDAQAITPRSLTRGVLAWVLIIVAIIGAGIIAVALERNWSAPDPLAADSPRYDGALAIVTLLEEDGVAVDVVGSRADAEADLTPESTLVITDTRKLVPDDLASLTEKAGHTVLLDTDFAGADAFFPGIGFGGHGQGPVSPECVLSAAEAAGDISPGAAYALPETDDVMACYPVGEGFALLQTPVTTESTVTVFDARAIIANDSLAEHGHAALALDILGDTDHLVWYTPSAADARGQNPASLTDLAPTWVTPLIVLSLLSAGAAALWRGRRFGPLVAENLPVTVRANETLEGRARLYRAANDTAHAADALRRGAIDRIRRRLALPPSASPQDIAMSAADLTERSAPAIHDILTTIPHDDAAFAAFAEGLRALEDDLTSTDLWEGRHP
ncbi:DUF4350 domain-containing protein [Microbacterium amylolyticum]|uniref:DUF4350 domain-containing protein n=1 Tax=Microbacterium amylolyticum TaxID=936337 RepID=A0ABS4ZJY2_9MICO|nr:DUF4350 domain-containing protein [Microbacterium amylolyticum]MBP2437592.1 hypothetical protein [Microbacterium amylolyticum]